MLFHSELLLYLLLLLFLLFIIFSDNQHELRKETLVAICCSTYGTGTFPANTQVHPAFSTATSPP
jgi:hypothetical protein